MSEEIFIMEFTKSQVLLMAQLVHIHLATEHATDVGRGLLKELVNQTTAVLDNAEHHEVFKPFKWTNAKIKAVPKLYYVPFDG